MNTRKTAMHGGITRSVHSAEQLQTLEYNRRRTAIRIVYALSAAGLLAVLVNWIAG